MSDGKVKLDGTLTQLYLEIPVFKNLDGDDLAPWDTGVPL